MKIALFTTKLQSEQGFMLADILLAVVIISVALLAIATVSVHAMQSNTLARDYTLGANLARSQLELLKTHRPADWSKLTEPTILSWQDDTEYPPTGYTIETSAVPSANEPLVQVTVKVEWRERGIPYSMQFLTLYPTL